MLKPTQEQIRAANQLLRSNDFKVAMEYIIEEAEASLLNCDDTDQILPRHRHLTSLMKLPTTLEAMNAYLTPTKE